MLVGGLHGVRERGEVTRSEGPLELPGQTRTESWLLYLRPESEGIFCLEVKQLVPYEQARFNLWSICVRKLFLRGKSSRNSTKSCPISRSVFTRSPQRFAQLCLNPCRQTELIPECKMEKVTFLHRWKFSLTALINLELLFANGQEAYIYFVR